AFEQTQKEFADGQALANKKAWRKVLEKAEPRKNQGKWAALVDQATRALDDAKAALVAVAAARDAGHLEDALKALSVVETADPENPEIWELRPRLQELKNKRETGLKHASGAVA